MSFCYGPGIQDECSVGAPAEFIIQARNGDGRRTSGHDEFSVKVQTVTEQPRDIHAEIVDKGDGSYFVSYACEEEVDCKVTVQLKDDKGNMVDVRGSPYTVNFSKNIEAENNSVKGPSMLKLVQKQVEQIKNFIQDTTEGVRVNNKDLKDPKTLIEVKGMVEVVKNQASAITLKFDQLDESIKLLEKINSKSDELKKEAEKLFDEWNGLKKLAKDVKKEISPQLDKESTPVSNSSTNVYEELSGFNKSMEKKKYYQYDSGYNIAMADLEATKQEITEFQAIIGDLKSNANEFGDPEIIRNAERAIEVAINEVQIMTLPWDLILEFNNYLEAQMPTRWADLDCNEMEEVVYNYSRTAQRFPGAVKKYNVYSGAKDLIDRWDEQLPLIEALHGEYIKERHWNEICKLINVDINYNDESFCL